MVLSRQTEFSDTHTRLNLIGIILCILSVLPLFLSIFISPGELGILIAVCIILLIAGIGVALLTFSGTVSASFSSPDHSNADTSWIIWAIADVLYAAPVSVLKLVTAEK